MKKSRKRPAAQKRNHNAPRRQHRSSSPAAASASIAGYTSEAALAEQLGLTMRTLRKWRATGIGPPYTKIARFCYYSDQSWMLWLKNREIMPVRSAPRTSMAV
jgi:hypothetical protein